MAASSSIDILIQMKGVLVRQHEERSVLIWMGGREGAWKGKNWVRSVRW